MTDETVRIDPVWARSPLDAYDHGNRHAAEDDTASLRHAVLAFDQAVEGIVVAYLLLGPGVDDLSPEATDARRKRGMGPKITYLFLAADMLGEAMAVPADEGAFIHSVPNGLQHEPRWSVPTREQVATAQRAAQDAIRILAGIQDGHHDGMAAPPDVPQPSISPVPMAARERRALTVAAWELAQRLDPEAEGIHSRYLAERLVADGQDFGERDPARVTRDALNRAKDRFARPAGTRQPSVFAWTALAEPPPVDGLSQRDLADVCYAYALAADPERRGLHYAGDTLGGLRRWHVPIRGIDNASTVNKAVRDDPRFEKTAKRGVYRVRESHGGSSGELGGT